jgi:4-amino-4-deoxy-L-arabinose transferase-like glycosyltransferase
VRVAAAGVCAMALIPGIGWESQRALAHTPLALAAASVTLAVFVTTRVRGGPGWHLVLGVTLGLAALSYWSAAFIGLGVAATLLVARRAAVAHVMATLVTAAGIAAPTAVWYGRHLDAVATATERVTVAAVGPAGTSAALGEAVLATLAVPLVVLLLALAGRRDDDRHWGLAPAPGRDLLLVITIATTLFAATALSAGLDEVKERYLTPVLFAVPLLVASAASARLTAARTRALIFATGTALLLVSAGLQWNWRWGDGEPAPAMAPFAPIVDRLTIPPAGVLAESEWVGGNLRFAAPNLTVLTPENAAMALDLAPPVRLVWVASTSETPPRALIALFERKFGRSPTIGPVRERSAPFPPPYEDAYPFALRVAKAH